MKSYFNNQHQLMLFWNGTFGLFIFLLSTINSLKYKNYVGIISAIIFTAGYAVSADSIKKKYTPELLATFVAFGYKKKDIINGTVGQFHRLFITMLFFFIPIILWMAYANTTIWVALVNGIIGMIIMYVLGRVTFVNLALNPDQQSKEKSILDKAISVMWYLWIFIKPDMLFPKLEGTIFEESFLLILLVLLIIRGFTIVFKGGVPSAVAFMQNDIA